MRSLYLSSFNLGRAPEELAGLAAAAARAAVIMNAADVFGPTSRARLPANIEALAGLGIPAEEIDLRDHFGAPERLSRALDRFGLVWAVGGNAFVLRRALEYSGLDEIARSRVADGTLAWAGFSAGAVVAGPTLAGVECVDDPDDVPEGYESAVPRDGLGPIDYSIVPHYRSPHPDSPLIEDMVRHLDARGLPYRTLRDGEAIVVRGDEERVVGVSGGP